MRLGKRCISWTPGKGVHCIFRGQSLLGHPATRRFSARILSSPRRINPQQRVRALDGKVAAKSQHRSRAHQAVPDVGASRPLLAQTRLDPSHIARGMGRLHAGDDPQFSKPRNVLPMEDLRMLDPVPSTFGASFRRPVEQIQRQPIRPIADGVDGHLKSPLHEGLHSRLQLRRGDQQQAALLGIVSVGRVEGRAPRAQRAIEPELHRAHRQHLALVGALSEVALGVLSLSIGHRVDAHRQPVRLVPAAEDSKGNRIHPRIVGPGQSQLGAMGKRRAQPPFELMLVDGGQLRFNQVHRVVHQHSGRFAAAIANDSPTRRVLRLPADPSPSQSFAVHPHGVAIDSGQEHRGLRKNGIQILVGGEVLLSLGPARLVPSSPDQPVALVAGGGRSLEPLQYLLLGGRLHQIHDRQAPAQRCQVPMRIDQAWNDGRVR